MKSLKNFEEDLYKCSKCGLCQTVCPVYRVLKKENLLARGRFAVLSGVCLGKLSLDKQTVKNLDLCLNCNACKDFCPSGIDAKEIFTAIKTSYQKTLSEKVFTSYWFFKLKMRTFSVCVNIYRCFQLDKIVKVLVKYFKLFPFREWILFGDSIVLKTSKRKKVIPKAQRSLKVAFFEGCFNKYINNSSENASLNLIEAQGYQVEIVKNECCSISLLYAGNFDEFKKNALKIISATPNDAKYIVCDCDSCVSVLKGYSKYFDEAKEFSKKVISLSEFLTKNGFKKECQNNLLVSYHKPCHGKEDAERLLKKINPNHYVPLKQQNLCCGFSGDFGLRHFKIASAVAKLKTADIVDSKCEKILTTCPSCLIGLKLGLTLEKQDIEVQNLSEYLDD